MIAVTNVHTVPIILPNGQKLSGGASADFEPAYWLDIKRSTYVARWLAAGHLTEGPAGAKDEEPSRGRRRNREDGAS